ncbi:MAG: hypothetical protein J1E01_09415 [Acetatifactor sp.]|nr:hypothetical protein [Acetatifactor sp.]
MSISLTYRPDLYLGDSINENKLDKIIKKLEKNPVFSGVFLITVSRNASDQLDIFDARQLAQSYYKKHPPYVVGIAGSHDEAVELVERLVQECLRARGDCALKEYLLC